MYSSLSASNSMYVYAIRKLIAVFLFLAFVGCVPKPTEKQVVVKPGTAGELSVEGPQNLGILPVSQNYAFQIVLTNNGGLDINFSPLKLNAKKVISFVGDLYPGVGGDCTNVLLPGESCRINLQVFSNDLGNFSEGYSLTYTNGIDRQTYSSSFRGYLGRPANLQVVGPNRHDFGIVEPGAPSEGYVVTIENRGELDATDLIGFYDQEDPVVEFVGGSFPGTQGTCGGRLRGGQSCTIHIHAIPVEADNEYQSVVGIAYKSPIDVRTLRFPIKVFGAEIKAYLVVQQRSQDIGDVLNKALEEDVISVTWTVANVGYAKATEIALTPDPNIPLVFKESDCPVDGLFPQQSCNVIYDFKPVYERIPPTQEPQEPLPGQAKFPVKFAEYELTISYNDNRNPELALTPSFAISAIVLDEAFLVLYRNGNSLTPFDWDREPDDGDDLWERVDWTAVLGATPYPSRNIRISNPGSSERIPATNVTYEIIPNDGQLVLACLASNNCPNKLNDGGSYQTQLRFLPIYDGPENLLKEYTLRVSYFSGTRQRTYDLTVETRAIAMPLVRFRRTATTTILTSGATINFPSTLADKPSTLSFDILNNGPTDYLPEVALSNLATLDKFEIPPATNTCIGASLKNGSSCSFVVRFQKPTFDGAPDTTPQKISFNNGLSPSDSIYEAYEYNLVGTVVAPGFLEGDIDPIEYPLLPWSQTGQTDKSATRQVTIPRGGSWPISQTSFEIVGPGAAYYSFVNPPTMNNNSSPAWSGNLRFTAPDTNLPDMTNYNATLIVRYYGEWQADFVDFDPDHFVAVDLIARVDRQPHLLFSGMPTGFGPLVQGFSSAPSPIRIVNTGQIPPNTPSTLTINNANFAFDNIASHGGCSVNNWADARTIEFTLDGGEECIFDVIFTSPGPGTTNALAKIEYQNTEGQVYEVEESFSGAGLFHANIIIAPGNNNGADFANFGELRLTQENSITFTFSNAQNNSAPGEIIGVSLLPLGSPNCPNSSIHFPTWKDYEQIDGHDDDYEIVLNSCTPGNLVVNGSPATNCQAQVYFKPSRINTMIGSCLEIEYKPYPDALIPPKRTVRRLMAVGLPPFGIFNGWQGLFGEGETDDVGGDAFIKLQWKPMAVEQGLGTIEGYNVFRRRIGGGQNNFLSTPLNETLITLPQPGGFFQFIEKTTSVSEGYDEQIEAGRLYEYVVYPMISIPGMEGIHRTTTTEIDRFITTVVPYPYTILLNRETVNINVCTKMLMRSYSSLDRGNSYNCSYTGHGSNGGVFDYGKDAFIDRYENSRSGLNPTNSPGTSPHLYSTLAEAKQSCDAQMASIPALGIIMKKKRLVNRMDYMIASEGQSRVGCLLDETILGESGRNACRSQYGVEDMIGNAWDMVDAEIVKGLTSEALWNYSSGTGYGNNRRWPFPLEVLDFNYVDFYDPNSFTDNRTFSAGSAQCIHPLFGFPKRDIAGICAFGSVDLSDFSSGMNLDERYTYIFTLKNTESVFDFWEGRRNLMAGGSYNSMERFGLDVNRYTQYWTNNQVETIMYSNNPDGQWEGGAARCILDIVY